MFLEAIKLYYVEKTTAILKKEVDEIVENKNLTDEEKKSKIIKHLKSFIEDKTKKGE